MNESLQGDLPATWAALDKLDEEVNVLRIMNLPLGTAANKVLFIAEGAVQVIGLHEAMDQSIANMHAALHDMWLLANPDE